MAAASGGSKVEGFRFRRLEKPEEFRQVDEVQQAVWGPESTLAVPPPLMRTLQDNGGLVLGAFADIYLAGVAVSLIGWDGTTLYHYSHLTVVRPEYQNHHLGFRLKAFQRDEVLKLGLAEIREAFDPLQSKTAWLLVRRLGGTPDRYYPHYFGQLADAVNREMETDRLRCLWSIATPRVEERVAGKFPSPEADRGRWAASSAIVETEPGESGLRVPTAVGEPSGSSAHLEVPFDLAAVREHEPASVRRWRHAVRDAFRAAFDLGYAVDDFTVLSTDHERRSFYLLSKAAAAPTAPSDPSGSV
jgi:predicted GNAT superfamily acetyltransferase